MGNSGHGAGFVRGAPWWLKIPAKILLSRLREPLDWWRRLGLFKHGRMLDPDYALGIYRRHVGCLRDRLPDQPVILELGPGDSISTGLIAAADGASRTWLVDVGRFAPLEAGHYRALLERLGAPLHLREAGSGEELLERSRTTYLTEGLASLGEIPDESVDLCFSHAVLEHVALDEFEPTVRELRRILRPAGICSHRIDFRDHLSGGLHSLRFSPKRWESPLFARSGFYTNRLRIGQVIETLERAGFEVHSREDDVWPRPPLPRRKLHREFRDLPDTDLVVRGSSLVVG